MSKITIFLITLLFTLPVSTNEGDLELRLRSAKFAPSEKILNFQRNEMNAFIHFSPNTYTGKIIGDGSERPDLVNPTKLDTDQWARIVKEGGMKIMILTAKHHDGYCLWPSEYTDYSIKQSPWINGQGDIVKMAAESAKKYGLKFGIYYSMTDGHEKTYGTPEYYEYVNNQMTELLTNYGEIAQVWLDYHRPKWAAPKEQPGFDLPREELYKLIEKLQPNAVISPRDISLEGKEKGVAPKTWFNVKQNGVDFNWKPMEIVTSIRDLALPIPYTTFWFHHWYNSLFIRSKARLIKLYFNSVGRGGVLLFNFPPNKQGLIGKKDEANFLKFAKYLKKTFKNNLLKGARIEASDVKSLLHIPENMLDNNLDTFWATTDGQETATINIELPEKTIFNIIMLKEHIKVGQRIEKFDVEIFTGRRWKKIAEGTTIGNKRLIRIRRKKTNRLRINIRASKIAPTLEEIGLFLDK